MVKGNSRITICTNLLDFASQMLIPRFSLKAFLVLEEIFKCLFLPYMGVAAILFNSAEPFEKVDNTTNREPSVKSG